MKIDINKPNLNVEVGDILRKGEECYLVCKSYDFLTNTSKYFLLDLRDCWLTTNYYNDIQTLLKNFSHDYLIKNDELILTLKEN